MKVVVFGATGMVGQGVLRACLADGRVEHVLAVGRTRVSPGHPKLTQIVRPDVTAVTAGELTGYDACFFCLGVSSVGLKEDEYRRVTYDLTMSVARTFAGASPGAAFVYVSGAGTDSSERGRVMWARVKGATENAILALPLRAYMFRPGYIQPVGDITSKTRLYAALLKVVKPFYPMLRRLFPGAVTTTQAVGEAMIAVAADGFRVRVLGPALINEAAGR